MKIAQTQTEQINSPTMTVFTIQWACQNSVNSERSEEVSGNTDCATSGFMSTSFPLSGCGRPLTAHFSNGKSAAAIATRSAANSAVAKSLEPVTVRTQQIRAKLGRTWARSRAEPWFCRLNSADCG